MIKKLINFSNNRIKIMPGSGINSTNILEFINLDVDEIHGSFSKDRKSKQSVSSIDEILRCNNLMTDLHKKLKK